MEREPRFSQMEAWKMAHSRHEKRSRRVVFAKAALAAAALVIVLAAGYMGGRLLEEKKYPEIRGEMSAGFGEAEPRMLDAGSFGPGTRVEGMAVLFEEIIVFYPYRVSFARVARELERGACLSKALERFAELYDRRLVTLLRVGEQTGRLPEMLAREGDVLTGELEHRLRLLGNLLEPVLILLVGLLVAVILVAMHLPMFRLGGIMG